MAGQRGKIQEDIRFRILCLLQDNPDWSQREIADAVGISNGGVHYVLRSLVKRGLVKFGNFSASKDKRRYAYVLTPQGIAERASVTRRFLTRKTEEYEVLRAEIRRLRRELEIEHQPRRRQSR